MRGLPPLYGLVLAGGESRRMGRDKAVLDYHGRPQVEWAYELLARHCERTWISVRASHADDGVRATLPQIVDGAAGQGPIAGIAAAQAAHSEAAWLVVACDLPFLDDALVADLLARRGSHPVTAYRSAHDGLPEPLCAIYEPSTRAGILASIEAGRNCPRKFVLGTGVPLLELPRAAALDNVNTPEDLAGAAARLSATPDPTARRHRRTGAQ
jgi:molybdopterin-guanine dinucleotide biosynthesis protein A